MNNGYGEFAYVYDELNRDFPYGEVADCYDALIRKFGAPGEILLDIGCGTGTLAFLMEQKGYDVVGIDASEEMLSYALEKKMESGSDALFLCQRMEELDMFGTMDVTISCLDCINHLSGPDAVKTAFEKVHLFSHPDGLFLFDCNTVHKHRNVLAGQTFVYETEDVYCVWQNTLAEQDVIQIDLDIFAATDEESIYERYGESFAERAYEREVIEGWLAESGFELLAVYDGFSSEQPKEDSERLLFVARAIK